MKKNVLFVSTGTYAFGESVMALNFAQSLPPSKYRISFVASPLNGLLLQDAPQFEARTLHKGAAKINQLVVEDLLAHYPPALIVLWDFLTFDYSQLDFGITLDLLRRFDAPIISLDTYEWESGDFSLDFFTGAEKRLPQTLLELEGALRPCPLNRPAPMSQRAACYSFFDQIRPPQVGDARRVREDMGLSPHDFLIFSAAATWQTSHPRERYGGAFAAVMPRLIDAYVSRLDADVHWIHVGPDRERSTVRRGRVTEHNFPQLRASEFDALLAASDLLITTNVASTTLVKHVRYGGRALLLRNSIQANGPGDLLAQSEVAVTDEVLSLLEGAYPIHRFMMFPLGWYRFLSPVLADNPYLSTFHVAEVLDEERVVSILRQALAGSDVGLREQRAHYQRLLSDLPSPDECLEHFMAG